MSIHVSNEDLAAYLEDALDAESRAIVDSHLADCDQCRGRCSTCAGCWLICQRNVRHVAVDD